MRSFIFAFGICALLTGCGPKAEPQTANGSTGTGTIQAKAVTGGSPNSSGGITPIGPNVGAMTPVAGGEDLGSGTGGGVAQMAKSQARKAASQSNSTSSTEDGSE